MTPQLPDATAAAQSNAEHIFRSLPVMAPKTIRQHAQMCAQGYLGIANLAPEQASDWITTFVDAYCRRFAELQG